MNAYEDALRATSRPWAPWYAIPADDKAYMRMQVGEIIVATLESLDIDWPTVQEEQRKRFEEMRVMLEERSKT
jgi:hypothetical protein